MNSLLDPAVPAGAYDEFLPEARRVGPRRRIDVLGASALHTSTRPSIAVAPSTPTAPAVSLPDNDMAAKIQGQC